MPAAHGKAWYEARGVSFRVPKGVKDAIRVGLGKPEARGSGFEQSTADEARQMVRSGTVTLDKLFKMRRFWARNERFLKAPGGSPAWYSAKVWGGRTGMTWSRKLAKRIEDMDKQHRSRDNADAETNPLWQELFELAEDGRTAWRKLFSWGTTKHPKGDFTVDREFAEKLVESFKIMAAQGYFPPALEEHEAKGKAFGVYREVEIRADGIWALLEGAKGVIQQMKDGFRPYISPSFYPKFTNPHTGEELENVVREISFVGVPHLKNVGPVMPDVALCEAGFEYIQSGDDLAPHHDTTTMGDTNMDNKEMMERMDMLEKELGSMREMMASYASEKENMEEPKEEMAEAGAPAAPAEMSEQIGLMASAIEDLRAQNRTLTVRADVATRLGEVSDEELVTLSEAHKAGKGVYEMLISNMAAARSKPAKAPAVDLAEQELGAAGSSVAKGGAKSAEAFKQAVIELAAGGGRELPPHKHFTKIATIMDLDAHELAEVWDDDVYCVHFR